MESEKCCALCGKRSQLLDSHILPAFAFKWLKNRSVTGHIRRTDIPNKRTQDGIKEYLLCANCECAFSKFEREFANKIFHPWHDGGDNLAYDRWMLKFCVSLSWRALKYCYGKSRTAKYTEKQKQLVKEAEFEWRKYLNNEIPHPGRYEQHLLVMDTIQQSADANWPENINRYLTGAIDIDIVGSNCTLMTYVKLGRFCFFGVIQNSPDKWEGTKVHVKHGVVKSGTFVVPYGLKELFKEKALHGLYAMRSLSDQQIEKIDMASIKNIEKFKTSDQLRAMMADAEMFGLDAVVRKRRELVVREESDLSGFEHGPVV